MFTLFLPYEKFSDIRAKKTHDWRDNLVKKFGAETVNGKDNDGCNYFNWIDANSTTKGKDGRFYATQAFSGKQLAISPHFGGAMFSRQGLYGLKSLNAYVPWTIGYLVNYVRDFWQKR